MNRKFFCVYFLNRHFNNAKILMTRRKEQHHMTDQNNQFRSKKNFELNGKTYNYYDLKGIEEAKLGKVSRLPFSIRILLESVIRQYDAKVIKDEHVEGLAKWGTDRKSTRLNSSHVAISYAVFCL